jgi:hypothetical protein
MANLKLTTVKVVVREVPVESLTIEERRELIKRYCTIHEIRRAINTQLFPIDYLMDMAVRRANAPPIDEL